MRNLKLRQQLIGIPQGFPIRLAAHDNPDQRAGVALHSSRILIVALQEGQGELPALIKSLLLEIEVFLECIVVYTLRQTWIILFSERTKTCHENNDVNSLHAFLVLDHSCFRCRTCAAESQYRQRLSSNYNPCNDQLSRSTWRRFQDEGRSFQSDKFLVSRGGLFLWDKWLSHQNCHHLDGGANSELRQFSG